MPARGSASGPARGERKSGRGEAAKGTTRSTSKQNPQVRISANSRRGKHMPKGKQRSNKRSHRKTQVTGGPLGSRRDTEQSEHPGSGQGSIHKGRMAAAQGKSPMGSAGGTKQVIVVLGRPLGHQNQRVDRRAKGDAGCHLKQKGITQGRKHKRPASGGLPRAQPGVTQRAHSVVSRSKQRTERLRTCGKQVQPQQEPGSEPPYKPWRQGILSPNHTPRRCVRNVCLRLHISNV